MSRSLTSQEKVLARSIWPRMKVDATVVTDEATHRYNCLAWTLGITTSWIWPWGSRDATKAEFDSFYLGQGFSPSGSGAIAALGLDSRSMTHGCIAVREAGARRESKAGAWLRIEHGLSEIEGGSLYGSVLGYYVSQVQVALAATGTPAQSFLEARSMNELLSLDQSEVQYVHARVAGVPQELRRRFHDAYTAWQATWSQPLIALSSAPIARAQSPEFESLIALGPGILPLLMEKLIDPEEFFALLAVDRLRPAELLVSRHPRDRKILSGEQGRAIETVQRWIQSEQ